MYTDATLAALLRDVLDAPDDDDARLRYADRLDDLGAAEHAEFIRIQADLGRVYNYVRVVEGATYTLVRPGMPPQVYYGPQEVDDTGRDVLPLRRRADAILPTLTLPLAFMACEEIRYSRGFVDSIALTAADWILHANVIIAAHPVREVTLTTWPATEWLRTDNHDGPWERRGYRLMDRLGAKLFGGIVPAAEMLRAEWPTVAEWHLPAEMDENGGYVVPEHLAPAIEAMHAGGGVLHGPIHQLAPPGWTP